MNRFVGDENDIELVRPVRTSVYPERVARYNPMCYRNMTTPTIDLCPLDSESIFKTTGNYHVIYDVPTGSEIVRSEQRQAWYWDKTIDEVLIEAEQLGADYATVFRAGDFVPICHFGREELDDDIIWLWD